MTLAKLGKQLRREATANPKKAGLLGVALVVAIWFWGPLVYGWVGKDGGSGDSVSQGEPTAGTATTMGEASPAPTASAPAVPGGTPWSEIRELMDGDPRTVSAPALAMERDPFDPVGGREAEIKAAQEELDKAQPPVIAPSTAGLVLSGTVVGGERHVAQINGKTYVVGQTITTAGEKGSKGVAFMLVEIRPRSVVLVCEGERFELTIPEPPQSGKIEFFGVVEQR